MPSLKVFKDPVYRVIEPVVASMVRWRVHPNAITTLGFAVTVAAGVLFHFDHVRWAGLFVLLGGILDIFDGQVARRSDLASKFGSFYDSTLDRISEIVVFLGLLSLYNQYGRDLADVWKPGIPVEQNAAYVARAKKLNRELEAALLAKYSQTRAETEEPRTDTAAE